MKTSISLRMLVLLLLAAFALAFAAYGCAGSSDDDDDAVTGTTLSGTIFYEGSATGDKVIIGAMEAWPPTGPPVWFDEIPVSGSGFPFDYQVECSVTGSYYITAFLDADPNDGVSVNVDLDPSYIPDGPTDIIDGQDNVVDMTLMDDAWGDDDDDDTGDDDTGDDDDDDDIAWVAGNIAYSGSANGDTVVVCFYDYWPPMGPPKHSFDVPVPEKEWPGSHNGNAVDAVTGATPPWDFDYEIEVDFTGNKWRIVAFLDVDPGDTGYNPSLDPADMSGDMYTIETGQTTTRNFVLVDP